MGWTVKQAAKIVGLPADTLRYYDKEGIVSPKRTEGGYRRYEEGDIALLKNLVIMKYAHFSLAEIKSMEELFDHSPGVSCNEISKNILTAKANELRQAISNYQSIINLIEELLPLIDNTESYKANKDRIEAFVGQIFEGIHGDNSSLQAPGALANNKEAL